MKYYTDKELQDIRNLEAQLAQAVPHSKRAQALGMQIGEVHRLAHIRLNPPNPVIDRAMARLAKRLGIK